MAKIGSPYGIHGELVLHYYTDSIENLLQYSNWSLKLENTINWLPLSSEEVYRIGSKIIIKFPDANTREQAVKYINAEVGVLRDDFPELENEFYWQDLIGCEVVNHENKCIGSVTSLIETGANDVLVVADNNDEILIPFVADYVLDVCIDQKKVKIYWEEDFS